MAAPGTIRERPRAAEDVGPTRARVPRPHCASELGAFGKSVPELATAGATRPASGCSAATGHGARGRAAARAARSGIVRFSHHDHGATLVPADIRKNYRILLDSDNHTHKNNNNSPGRRPIGVLDLR